MSTATEIMEEMSETHKLITARKLVDPDGSQTVALKRKLAASIATKISHMTMLSPGGAKDLLGVVSKIDYDTSGRDIIVAAIDAKLEEELDTVTATKPSKKNQLCLHATNWVTASFVTTMRGKGSIDVKISVAAEWLSNKLGVKSPHEQTNKMWLTLVLLLHYDVWPRYRVVYDLLQLFKKELATHRATKWAFPAMSKYPKLPTELSEPIFNHIFGAEPPTVVHIERFMATAKAHVPLRKNSKLITSEEKALKADIHGGQPSAVRSTQHVAMPPSLKHEASDEIPSWARHLLAQQGAPPPHIPAWPPVKREPEPESKPALAGVSSALADESMPPWARAMFAKLGEASKIEPRTPKDEHGGGLSMPPKLRLNGALSFRRSAHAEASNTQHVVGDTSSHRPSRIYRMTHPFVATSELLGFVNPCGRWGAASTHCAVVWM